MNRQNNDYVGHNCGMHTGNDKFKQDRFSRAMQPQKSTVVIQLISVALSSRLVFILKGSERTMLA